MHYCKSSLSISGHATVTILYHHFESNRRPERTICNRLNSYTVILLIQFPSAARISGWATAKISTIPFYGLSCSSTIPFHQTQGGTGEKLRTYLIDWKKVHDIELIILEALMAFYAEREIRFQISSLMTKVTTSTNSWIMDQRSQFEQTEILF